VPSHHDRKQSVESESAVLVGVQLPDHSYHGDPLDELTGLVETAGAVVVGRITQKRHAPDAAAYIGHG
jgi:GTP-binding protein HflX